MAVSTRTTGMVIERMIGGVAGPTVGGGGGGVGLVGPLQAPALTTSITHNFRRMTL